MALYVFSVVLGLIIVLGVIFVIWKNRAPLDIQIGDSLELESWNAVPPDAHHSNTDLFKFRDQYLLVHATSRWHFASTKCKLVVRSSPDGRNWKVLSEVRAAGEDVRDPKLAFIDGKLLLYFLSNSEFEPRPFDTSYCVSDDAVNWSEPKKLSLNGWLLWRPKTLNGKTFYAPAYWWEHGRAVLFKTENGLDWVEVGSIYEGDTVDETAISFRPDGTMIMTARLEVKPNYWGYHPEGHTLIGTSPHPYMDWQLSRSHETRLDGPCLFQAGEHTYAVGRRHVGGASHMGSAWGRKRTSIYLVLPEQLVFLSDLPSSGDTSYAGAVVEDDSILISYYTSPPDRDYIWLLGMFSKSSIEMARLKIENLERLAEEKSAKLKIEEKDISAR